MAKRILLVDPDHGEGALLRLHLDRVPDLKAEIDHALNEEEALRRLQEYDYDLVFLEAKFGRSPATPTLHRIRDVAFEVPVIVLTSTDDAEVAVDLVQAGADDYLPKGRLGPGLLSDALANAETRSIQRRMQHDLEGRAIELSDMLERESLALRRLELAMERVESANRSKTAFLANMSHEIRTPLTAILGYSEELLQDELSAAEQREAVKVIHQNGEFLLQIVSDILDLSKIESGKIDLETVRFSPTKLVAEVCQLMDARARAKGIRLTHHFDGPVPEQIHSDPTRVRQILLNLLSNAIKFTAEGGVRLTTRLVEWENGEIPTDGSRCLEFEVRDSGIGMTPDQIDNVFEAFSQADSSTTRRFGGTGLGLTICDRLTRLLGGVVRVESEPGSGSTFRVTISTGSLLGVRVISAREASELETPAAPRELEPLPPCRILVADDNAVNRRLITRMMERLSATVDTAENGREAVDRALGALGTDAAYHLVLMDLEMPELDGWAATEELRRAGFTAPIVALTGNAFDSARQRSVEVGFDAFATKPIRRDSLAELVRHHLMRVVADPKP